MATQSCCIFLPFLPRRLITLVFLSLSVMFLPAVSGAQQACDPDGDVDQNGSITAADALLAFQQALGLTQLTACQLSIADVSPRPASPDGNITASDALCIFQKALGLPSCTDLTTEGVAQSATGMEIETDIDPETEASRLYFPFGHLCVGSCVEVHYRLTGLPNQNAGDAARLPLYYQVGDARGRLHVGVDPQLNLHLGFSGNEDVETEIKGERGNFDIRYYEVNDGVGDELLAQFLQQSSQLANSEGERVVSRFVQPPVVSFGGQVTPAHVNRLVRAVQLVNAALPLKWRLKMPSEMPTAEEAEHAIYVRFMTDLEYDDTDPSSLGYTHTVWSQDATIQRAVIKVKESYSEGQPTVSGFNIIRVGGERRAVAVLAHELLHALGLGHVPNAFASIMTVGGSLGGSHPSTPQPLSLLYPMDREALRALYGRLHPLDLPMDFGPWNSTSLHLHGNGNHSGFGVSLRNGYAEPYSYGYVPDADLVNNPDLVGEASWEGLLLGFTPESTPVAGDAQLSVNLDDRTGSAEFTNLESWAAGEVPGDSGTGTIWGGGNLAYSIAVTGNTFWQTGGDDGSLTGAFFGQNHEGMGGTLERVDLTAAFGGKR